MTTTPDQLVVVVAAASDLALVDNITSPKHATSAKASFILSCIGITGFNIQLQSF